MKGFHVLVWFPNFPGYGNLISNFPTKIKILCVSPMILHTTPGFVPKASLHLDYVHTVPNELFSNSQPLNTLFVKYQVMSYGYLADKFSDIFDSNLLQINPDFEPV